MRKHWSGQPPSEKNHEDYRGRQNDNDFIPYQATGRQPAPRRPTISRAIPQSFGPSRGPEPGSTAALLQRASEARARQDQAHAERRADLAHAATAAAEASRQANEAFERAQTERALNASALQAQRAAAGLRRSDSTGSSSSWEARRAAIWGRDQSWQARRNAINDANPGAGGSGGGSGADGEDPDADQLEAARAAARRHLAYGADDCSYEEGILNLMKAMLQNKTVVMRHLKKHLMQHQTQPDFVFC